MIPLLLTVESATCEYYQAIVSACLILPIDSLGKPTYSIHSRIPPWIMP